MHVNKYTLDTHITSHHPDSARACAVCGKLYGLTELLNKHIRVKHDSTPRVEVAEGGRRLGWQCRTCPKVISNFFMIFFNRLLMLY